jgi:hypothetical protein
LKPTYNKTECVNTIAIRLWDTKAGYHSITCGEGLERKMMYFQYIGVGAAPTLRSTQLIMGKIDYGRTGS